MEIQYPLTCIHCAFRFGSIYDQFSAGVGPRLSPIQALAMVGMTSPNIQLAGSHLFSIRELREAGMTKVQAKIYILSTVLQPNLEQALRLIEEWFELNWSLSHFEKIYKIIKEAQLKLGLGQPSSLKIGEATLRSMYFPEFLIQKFTRIFSSDPFTAYSSLNLKDGPLSYLKSLTSDLDQLHYNDPLVIQTLGPVATTSNYNPIPAMLGFLMRRSSVDDGEFRILTATMLGVKGSCCINRLNTVSTQIIESIELINNGREVSEIMYVSQLTKRLDKSGLSFVSSTSIVEPEIPEELSQRFEQEIASEMEQSSQQSFDKLILQPIEVSPAPSSLGEEFESISVRIPALHSESQM